MADQVWGRPGFPTDKQVDDFYWMAVSPAERDGLDLNQFMSIENRPLSARDAGQYGAILWHAEDLLN